MKNFKQHKNSILLDYCNSYKKPAYKEIWGINLNCNTKPQELMWLNYKLLQQEENTNCSGTCNPINPSFVITQYATLEGTCIFPQMFPFDPQQCFRFPQNPFYACSGGCSTKIIVNNGSTVTTYQYIVQAVQTDYQPLNGSTVFIVPNLIGQNIQISLSGWGFLLQGSQYSFDSTTGTITLLTGLLFRTGEIYTIFSYT